MKVIYNAFVLTEESQRKLMERFPPKFDNTFYHHMTINFGVPHFPENLGETKQLKIVGYAEDENGQAVVVDYDLSDNRIPHITLSTAEGVKPVYSNDLLQDGWRKIDPIFVAAQIKSYTNEGWVSEI